MTTHTPPQEDMKKLLEEVSKRVFDYTSEPDWDYRDVWLNNLYSYIRSLEKDHASMKEALEKMGICTHPYHDGFCNCDYKIAQETLSLLIK